ncbi:hypothetical protein SSX86_032188 [Deinandra increscens subsp. villosa]|uniref:K-box domain-containing protein n=1 Tax=Deinandra increscens subsp. villosa TaxID=3103831 RepID=A0AAP0C7S0_9ASTR
MLYHNKNDRNRRSDVSRETKKLSMEEMLGKYKLHSNENLDELVKTDEVKLSKEINDKNCALRQLEGQDLEGLAIDELEHLENLLQGGLSRVLQTKDEKLKNEIFNLQLKGARLMEENKLLKEQA